MTHRIFGYGRASHDKRQIPLNCQEFLCRHYADIFHWQHPDYTWAGWYPDASGTLQMRWLDRPMTQDLLLHMRPYDLLVISNLDRAFWTLQDARDSLAMLCEGRYHVVVLDWGFDSDAISTHQMILLLSLGGASLLKLNSRRTQEMMDKRKRESKQKIKLQPRGYAPVGWKWVHRWKQYFLKPCPQDRQMALEIVRLIQDECMPMKRIPDHLESLKIKPFNPLENYTLFHVKQCYVAALCGFQKIPKRFLPSPLMLMRYLALHDGQPPQLRPHAVSEGSFYTLPPMTGPPLVPAPRKLYAHLVPSLRAGELVVAGQCAPLAPQR